MKRFTFASFQYDDAISNIGDYVTGCLSKLSNKNINQAQDALKVLKL